jgi:hypothetical protein
MLLKTVLLMKLPFMKILLVFLFAMGSCIYSYAITSKRDTVYLYNGQVLIGEIRGLNGGYLSIDDADLKIIQIKLNKIKSVQSGGQFRIVTITRLEYYGTIKASKQDGYVTVTEQNDSQPIELPIDNINTMVALESNFLKSLNGNISLGFSYTKSSDIGQLNLNSTISYVKKLYESVLTVSSIGSLDSSKFSRDNENVDLFSIYNITSSWFAAASLGYQRNLELSLARRYQQMVGGGYKLLVRKHAQILALSGLAFNEEKSTSGDLSGLLIEIPVSFRFNLYSFSNPNIQISTSQSTYFSLSQHGRIRFAGTTNIYYELVRNFYLNVGPYSNYDNQPPNASSNTFDIGVTFGISYKL